MRDVNQRDNDDTDFARYVKLSRMSENPGSLRNPINGATNIREGDFIPKLGC